jgi:hypothetical protein
MNKYQKAAAAAIEERLKEHTGPVLLYAVACWADEAVRCAGKKGNLFGSLYDYADVLPAGWCPQWLGAEGSSDRMLYVTPPGWRPGRDRSVILMGGGKLVYA